MGLGGIHPIQLLIVLALVLLVFGGRGKISAMMGDMARGVRSFRKGLNEDETLDATPDARSEDMPEQTARRDSVSNADPDSR